MSDELTPEGLERASSTSHAMSPAQVLRLALAGLVVFAVVVFVLQNLESVDVDFLSFSFDAPLILLLLIAAFAGVLTQWLVRFVRHRRSR